MAVVLNLALALAPALALALALALTPTLTLGPVKELAAFERLPKLISAGVRDTTSVTGAVSFAVATNVASHVKALQGFPVRVCRPSPAWLRQPPAFSVMA